MILIVFTGVAFARVVFAKVVFTKVVFAQVAFAARRTRHLLVHCRVVYIAPCFVLGIVACGRMTHAVG